MTPDQAEDLLDDQSIRRTALTLSALDRLGEEEYRRIEKELRQAMPHSESMLIDSAQEAVADLAANMVTGNGMAIKMLLSVLISSLNILGRDKQVKIVTQAANDYEKLDIS
jgi:hypothetical protein